MNYEQLQALLHSMSLKEKVFQLVQIPGRYFLSNVVDTGTSSEDVLSEEERALVGSTLGVFGAEKTGSIQRAYMIRHPHAIR